MLFPQIRSKIVNALLYEGEMLIHPDMLTSAPTESIYHDDSGDIRNTLSDISDFIEFDSIKNDILSKSLRYVDDVKVHIWDMLHLPDEVRKRFYGDMRIILESFAKDPGFDMKTMKIRHPREVYEFIKALKGDTRIIERLLEREDKSMVTMRTVFEDAYDDGMAQGVAQGVAQGKAQGALEGINAMSVLCAKLAQDNRLDDIIKLSTDTALRNRLFAEYNISFANGSTILPPL